MEVQQLLDVARRNLVDAGVEAITNNIPLNYTQTITCRFGSTRYSYLIKHLTLNYLVTGFQFERS
jgi:hypothetical protein